MCQPEQKLCVHKAMNLWCKSSSRCGDDYTNGDMVSFSFTYLWRDATYTTSYDVCPVQLSPLVVYVYERSKVLEMTFSIKLGYDEILLLEFIKDQWYVFD